MSKISMTLSGVVAVAMAGAASAGYWDTFSTTWLPSGAQSGTLAGTVDGQNGWTTRDAFLSSTTVGKWDQQVMNVNDANGNRNVFRMSNAIASGTYSSQVFSATSGQVAGESNAALWNNRGTVGSSPTSPQFGAYAATNTITSSLSFRSATGAAQTGLGLTWSFSAKQSSVRMSYLRVVDNGSTGFDLIYSDPGANGAFGTGYPNMTIASGLSYTQLHTIDMGITFVDGVSNVGGQIFGNDIFTIRLNGSTIYTGTTWEAYYYNYERITAGTPRLQAVDSVLFRVSGSSTPTLSGGGFYFEDFSISNSAVPAPGAAALVGLAGLCTGRRRKA
jgi:MYXO-CTERM domain-containing protein